MQRIELTKDLKIQAINEMKKHFSTERDENIGDLSAELFLGFIKYRILTIVLKNKRFQKGLTDKRTFANMLGETNIYDNDYQLQFLFERCNGGVDMENAIRSNVVLSSGEMMERCGSEVRNLAKAQTNREYTIREVKTNDEELKKFLFSLGCYKGETITVLSILGENYVISVKDARYSVDKDLAEAIIV